MTTLIGLACVGWTVLELWRMGRSASSARRPGPPPGWPVSGARSARPPRRFVAWDEQGRRIQVEDLGRA